MKISGIKASVLVKAYSGKLFCIVLLLLTTTQSKAAVIDTGLADQISLQLHAKKQLPLYFPLSVKRFYVSQNFQPVWLKQGKDEAGQTWQAMLLMDCVLEYGLAHSDYHPDELRYELLHEIFEQPDKISKERQARFDIMLTDAMLTILNHLHYGKLNPELPLASIDAGQGDVRMDVVLMNALLQNNIMPSVLAVQPKSQAYISMQQWLHKWKGQYLDDCYEVPEASVRKVAVNMERLRWADIGEKPYIQVNIPSFTLSLFLKDTTYRFKVVTGSPSTPTPLLQSAIYSVAAVPRAELPNQLRIMEQVPNMLAKRPGQAKALLVFLFANRHRIDLVEMPETAWFKATQRAFSRGNIGLEEPQRFAELLLATQGAAGQTALLRQSVTSGKSRALPLKTPVPFKVTYLTCMVRDGQVVTYGDIYQLDGKLEQALYQTNR